MVSKVKLRGGCLGHGHGYSIICLMYVWLFEKFWHPDGMQILGLCLSAFSFVVLTVVAYAYLL